MKPSNYPSQFNATKSIIMVMFIIIFDIISYAQGDIYLESNEKNNTPFPTFMISNDGNYIIKSYRRDAIKTDTVGVFIFDVQTSKLLHTITTTNKDVIEKITTDSKSLIIKKATTNLYSWVTYDLKTGKLIQEQEIRRGWRYIDISDDSLAIISPGLKSSIVYDLKTDTIICSIDKINATFGSIFFKGSKYCIGSTGPLYGKTQLKLLDAHTGQLLDEWAPDRPLDLWHSIFPGPDENSFFVKAKKEYYEDCAITFHFTVENEKFKILGSIGFFPIGIVFGNNKNFMFGQDTRSISKFDLKTGGLLWKRDILREMTGSTVYHRSTATLMQMEISKDGEYIYATDSRNLTHIFSVKKEKVVAILYTWGQRDYAFVTPDGRMEGTREAIANLTWCQKLGQNEYTVPLASTYDQMYTPNLMSQVFSNTLQENAVSLETIVKYTPEIKILNPKPESKTSTPTLSITCELKENGDEITQVRIFVNDKLVSDETRGMKAAGNTATYNVTLLPGVNSVKAVAVTKNGYQSGAAEVMVTFSGTAAESRLYVMAIGIDKYKNPAYNLNYAVADASAIVDMINGSAREIFKSVNVYTYQNEKANRTSILAGFDEIASQAQPQDAFILFYAGHGVMSEGSPEVPKDFYLVLQNITQIFGNDEMMKSQGISAAELRELSKKISAQKQVVFLDACQSGAAVETFAMRGVAEERAILQLARSTGSYMIASTGSEQFASEFKELGHGVFTYALLQGLSCNADGTMKDKKVTIQELAAYLNDNIPALTEKYHGTVQYPKSWSKGMDFPISVCK
jgi:hypothetical protein